MTPATEAELADLVRTATQPMVVRGGGTRAIGVVHGDVLNTAALSGIELYEPGALTFVAQGGTPVAEIQAALAAEGQHLPFDVPDMRALLGRDGISTIGGVVAANASGPRRVQVGACRDSLIGVRFVTGDGNIVKNGGRVMKNVTGYDLVKLLSGSWGTLGVLTEVSFKVLPRPAFSATLILHGLSDRAAVAALAAGLGSPFEVTGAAHWPGQGTYMRIEGLEASVRYRAGALARHLAAHGKAEVENSAARWQSIRDVAPFHAAKGDVWRLSVTPSAAPEIVARMGAEAVLYDWGGGLIWALVEPGVDVRARLGAIPGHATLVRGDGVTFQPEAPALGALTMGLRAKFDPRGLFNPGLMGPAPALQGA
jgi:glycolate oxidase FAD binding subunit